MRFIKLIGLISVGGIFGAGAAYSVRLRQNAAVQAKQVMDIQVEQFKKLTADDIRKQNISLYGYRTCPFTGTLRALLDYERIPYINVEVEPIFKKQLKQNPTGYSKVPQLQIGDDIWLVDSDLTCSELSRKLDPSLLLGDDTSATKAWRTWVREIFVRLIVVNINRSVSEAMANYEYIDQYSDSISSLNRTFLKVVGGPVMLLVARYVTPKRLKRNGVDLDNADVRDVLHQQLSKFQAALQHQPYLGGQRPSLADVETFGVVRSLDGHNLRREMEQQNPVFKQWVERMETMVPRQ